MADYIFKCENGITYGVPAPNCLICKNCTDIFYDFENGPYMTFCKYNTKLMQLHFPNCERFELEENLITVSDYMKNKRS